MKTKAFAALALFTVAMGLTPALASARPVHPLVGREVGAPPPPMPIGPLTAREVGAPPPPMPIGPVTGNEVGAPPPPMPVQ